MFPPIFWPFLSATYVYAIIPQIQFHVCSPAIFLVSLCLQRRNIRLIEGNAECRCFFHLKNLTSKWTLRQVFICLKPRTPRTTYAPPLALCINYLCTYDLNGPVRNAFDAGNIHNEGTQFTKLGRKYWQVWLYLQSINSDKHLPLQVNILDYDILLCCQYGCLVHGLQYSSHWHPSPHVHIISSHFFAMLLSSSTQHFIFNHTIFIPATFTSMCF